MSKEINGIITGHFETGSEGTYWILQDEKHIDANGMYSYEGMNHLKSGQHLTIYYPLAKDRVFWEGELHLVNSYDERLLKKLGLLHYLKTHAYSGEKQLQLGGAWVHSLPLNIDLAVWYRICFTEENWPGKLILK